MTSPTADTVIKRLAELQSIRSAHERVWQQIANVAAPDAGDFNFASAFTKTSSSLFELPHAAKRSTKIFDTTAIIGVDRLASGIEAMICPQNERWHDLDVLDFGHETKTDEERRWLERVRNLLFKVRYDSDSGWVATFQTTLRRCVGFGNGFMFVDEGHDNRALIHYRALPLEECFVADNHFGQIDTFFRPYALTARQALQRFGASLPPDIARAADKEPSKRFTFIHAIGPREEWSDAPGVLGAPFYSVHVALDAGKVVRTSGYHEFPVIDFRWLPDASKVYAEGPVQKCLADIQSLQLMSKNEMLASQQAVNPPLLIPHAGILNRPNTNPGAINFGGMSQSGQRMIEPLNVGQRVDIATIVRTAKANQVKECLYLNLFQTLISNPQMSATESLIRAQEKGDLLGPAGGRIQQSLSNLVEREMGILKRKGAFNPDSAYRVPRSLQDKNVGAGFTSPLDRARRMSEAQGLMRLLEIANPMLAVDPQLTDHIDGDEAFRGAAEVLGVPAAWIRRTEVVEARRAQREQAQQMAAMSETVKNYAQAGNFASQAIANAGMGQAA